MKKDDSLDINAIKHDHDLIEKSFTEFEKTCISEQAMKNKFDKYGW